ncbi:tetratricopeptide repeat-containing family protein [Hibiscus syriacus]|uniref:Tetratricopeptide repeat-containing family protein n=1 Tax=Hibiscus syriacus TaxID=106335 RepID=A0A6A2XUN8_HIBSY|nr:tetratricopeptide repeat-containing family protein [Hibiscus syriacus]
MLQVVKDGDNSIVKLGLLSLLAVFKDSSPGYRIRLPTEKELEMKVSKEVKKMWFYESTLLSVYKGTLLFNYEFTFYQPMRGNMAVKLLLRPFGLLQIMSKLMTVNCILILLSSEANGNITSSGSGAHPLLAPCLSGLGKFSHLIDLDYIGDLMNYLKRLAAGGSNSDSSAQKVQNSIVSECLSCCIVAFKVMRSNLDALNVDLQDFFAQLYNLVLEYRPGRQHDMQKAAAFVKRLATFSLCFGSAESMSALVTLKQLLQKNVKCRNLLENDAGGGSVSGSIAAKYQPYGSDPSLSGALASVLWELNLLSKHYHPTISTPASGISSMNSAQNQVYINISPQQAFKNLSLGEESFNPQGSTPKSNNKRKTRTAALPSMLARDEPSPTDENEVSKKLSRHFALLRDIKENERVRGELDRTTTSLQLYEEYKKQRKSAIKKSKRNRICGH